MKLSASLLYLLVCCGPAQADVSLTVSPARSQFFKHETISLSCEEEEWSVRRHTRGKGNGTCNYEWGFTEGSSCSITLYSLDSGLYWCQSKSGELSRSISIKTSDTDVILESPVLPVPGGSDVTLRCLSKDQTSGNPSSDLPADFYKDGSLLEEASTGQMTIHSVYKSDEGFYKCIVHGRGPSPESWMDATDVSPTVSTPPLSPTSSPPSPSSSPPSPSSSPTSAAPPLISWTTAIIKLAVFTPYLVSTFIYISIVRARARARAAAAANAREGRDDDVIMEVAV